MIDDKGNVVNLKNNVKRMAKLHFNEHFKYSGFFQNDAQLKVIRHLPSLFNPEEGDDVGKHVTLNEIEVASK